MKVQRNPRRPRHEGARFEKCVECKCTWNVSLKAETPPSGYLCPRCRNPYTNKPTEKRSKQ